ncbi:MAG: alpha/beta fold hydrolase [Gammaproteobacteria bacterium]
MVVPAPQLVRVYHACRFGQVHVRRLPARDGDMHPLLLCLHPAPYSGAWFTTVMPLLNEGRSVIAPDYPGYGGSAPTSSPPSIEDYALAMMDVLDDMGITQTDVLGFHSGCLVAAEMALHDDARVRRLALIDVPFFVGRERDDMHARNAVPREFTGQLSDLADEWDGKITNRLDSMPMERAFELFVESLRSAGRSHWGFHAALTYASDERLALVATPARVIATGSTLLEPTRRAARALRNAELIERLDITRAVFEESAVTIAAEIDTALR